MCYICGKSRNKIAHSPDCRYVKMIPYKNRSYFQNRQETADAGYRYCRCCAPVLGYLRREKKDMDNYGSATGLSYTFDPSDGSLIITSRMDTWKIIANGRQNRIWLYHRNAFGNDPESMIPGYHCQHIRKSTILGYMDYIVKHDIFRERNPLGEEKKHVKRAKNPVAVRKALSRGRRKADRLSKHRQYEKQMRKDRRGDYYDEAWDMELTRMAN